MKPWTILSMLLCPNDVGRVDPWWIRDKGTEISSEEHGEQVDGREALGEVDSGSFFLSTLSSIRNSWTPDPGCPEPYDGYDSKLW